MRIIQNQFCVNCDWLQYHVKHNDDFLTREQPYVRFERKSGSKNYSSIYDIRDAVTGKIEAVYATGCNEAFMPKTEGTLKFVNDFLYRHSDNLKEAVNNFIDKKLNFKRIHVGRIDICMDIKKFNHNLSPEKFANDVIRGKYVNRMGQQFAVFGKQQSTTMRFQTLQFGSRQSRVLVKMYNKTEELKNNYKPHIKNEHEQIFGEQKGDVWRIEFSINSMRKLFKDKEVKNEFDEIFDSKGDDILDIKNLYGMYQYLFEKYFDFRERDRKFEKKNGKLQRMERLKKKELWIFDFDVLKMQARKIKRLPDAIMDSGRSIKIFIKKTAWHSKHFENNDSELADNAKKIISKLINIYHLEEWARDNHIEFDLINYARDISEFNIIKERELELQIKFNESQLRREVFERLHPWVL